MGLTNGEVGWCGLTPRMVRRIMLEPDLGGVQQGAAYTDINGSIFCTCNSFWGLQTPNTYQIDPTTGVGTPIFDTNTGPLTRNDGFSCPSASISEPTACMTILVESIECTPVSIPASDVNFEVCNNPNSNLQIGYFSVSVSNDMNAQISPSVFDLGVEQFSQRIVKRSASVYWISSQKMSFV